NATAHSRYTRRELRRRSRDQLGEPPQVLCDGRKCELELGTHWAAQTQSAEPEDAFEMGKQHLDAPSVTAGVLECFGFCGRPRDAPRRLLDTARGSPRPAPRAAHPIVRAAAATACPRAP